MTQFAMFTTIRFRLEDLHLAKQKATQLPQLINKPIYVVFEQEGDKTPTSPHMHVIVLTNTMEPYQSIIHTLFKKVTKDIVSLPKTKFLTADLLLRYLRGYKKGTGRKVRQLTQKWRRAGQLPSISTGGIVARTTQFISPSELLRVQEKINFYSRTEYSSRLKWAVFYSRYTAI